MDDLYEDDFEESQVASVAEKRSATSLQDQLTRNDISAEASVSRLSKQTSLLEVETNLQAGQSVVSAQYEDDFDSALPSAMDVDGPASLMYEDDFVESSAASSVLQSNSKIIAGEQTPLSNSTHSLSSVGPTNSHFATTLVSGIIANANLSAKIALSPTKTPPIYDARDSYPFQPANEVLKSDREFARDQTSPTPTGGKEDEKVAIEQHAEERRSPTALDDEFAVYQSDFQETDTELEAGPPDSDEKPASAKQVPEETNLPHQARPTAAQIASEGRSHPLELDFAGLFVRQASQAAFNAVVAARTPEKSVQAAQMTPLAEQPAVLTMMAVAEHADEDKEAFDHTIGGVRSDVKSSPRAEDRLQEERTQTPGPSSDPHTDVEPPAVTSPVVIPTDEAVEESHTPVPLTKEALSAENTPVVAVGSPQIAAGFVNAAFAQAVVSASAKYTSPPPSTAAAVTAPQLVADRPASPVREASQVPTVEAAAEPTGHPTPAAATSKPSRPTTPAAADVANFIASALTKATATILSTTTTTAGTATSSTAAATAAPVAVEEKSHPAQENGTPDDQQPSPREVEENEAGSSREPPQEQQAPDGPMVWDDDLNKLVPYSAYCASHDISTRPGNAESKTASQLRGVVNGNRSGSAKKLGKKAQADADRTFLTSLQLYQAPSSSAPKVDESPYRRSVSAAAKPRHVVTKRDLLRARSASAVRGPGSPARSASPGKAGEPKNKSPAKRHSAPSPKRKHHPAVDHRTVFVPPPLCLPSKTMPKELVNYLFASGRESDLKISLFCQHGRHFSTCPAELCIDAHEKYRWLNLIHIKAKEACELVCEADKMWRDKLEVSLAAEIEEKKQELEEQREELNRKLKKRSLAQTKLLRQGVQFYESALPALHCGDVTPEELYASTGWTEEHYENFKRRLVADQQRADFQRKMFLDQQVHKDGEVIEQLKGSLSAPMFYLDGMLKTRLDDIHTAVKRIDACFQSSIKLAAGIGTGKSEEQLKAEAASRSPQKNFVLAERLSRNTKHGFDILKNSLSIIARVCSDVRLMYKGIKRDHDMKQEKRTASANAASDRSRSPSPARKARPASAVETASPTKKARPQSAPTGSPSPPRKKKVRSVKSAAVRSSTEAAAAALNAPSKLSQGSRVSYAADFEDGVEEEESSLLIREDTYEDEIQDMMRDMGVGETGSRRSSSPTIGRRLGSGSIAEEVADEGSVASGKRDSRNKGAALANGIAVVEAEPSIALSVGSGIEDASSLAGVEGVSEKAAVMMKARSLATSRSGSNVKSGSNNNISTGEVDSEEDESDDADAKPGKTKDADKPHNLYDDDFEGDEDMVNAAFGGAKLKKSSSGKGKKKKRSVSRSKKVAGLMSADVLGVPLAHMKASQRNYQTVLHGLLAAHNVPVHIEDTEIDTKKAKLKPITITDVANRPIEINLAPPRSATHQTRASGVGAGERLARTATSKSPDPVRQSSSSAALGGSTLRCFNCHRKFPEAVVRHLPMPAVSNDESVFKRALHDVNKSKVYLPSFDPLHIPTSSAAQNKWIAQQLELQSELIAHKSQTDARAGSAALQKHKNPFCSWECVKGWAAVNTKLQMWYNTEILIDVAAGYTVVPTIVDRAAK